MKNKRERVLFLTTIFPYPLDGGGKIRAFNNLQALSSEYDIDLVCFSEDKVDIKHIEHIKKYCEKVRIIEKIFSNNSSKLVTIKNMVKSFIKNSPFIIEKFNDNRYHKIVKELNSKYAYKAVFFEHLSISCYKKEINPNIKQILSQQNCEFILMKRRYENEKNLLKKIYTYIEYLKLRRYEIRICSDFDEVIMLSKEDKKSLLDNGYKQENMKIIPIGVNADVKKKTQYNDNRRKNILFMGTMTWYPNEQGILWFIDNVWVDIKKKYPDMSLYIVGKSPSNEVLNRSKLEGIVVTGYVDDIHKYIEICDVCIVPLFIGGGMRVKILESMARGMPCISTSIGAEGIEIKDSENILIANDSDGFINAIEIMIEDNKKYNSITNNAVKLIEEKYSTDVIKKEVLSVLN